MNDLIPIKVKCHSGYKTDEYPKYFYWEGVRFDIAEIIDRWYQGENTIGFPVSNYYKVITTDNKTYLLKHEVKKDNRYLFIHGESMNI